MLIHTQEMLLQGKYLCRPLLLVPRSMHCEQELLEGIAPMGYHWSQGVCHSANSCFQLCFAPYDRSIGNESARVCMLRRVPAGCIWNSVGVVSIGA